MALRITVLLTILTFQCIVFTMLSRAVRVPDDNPPRVILLYAASVEKEVRARGSGDDDIQGI